MSSANEVQGRNVVDSVIHLPVHPSEVLYCTSNVALIQFQDGKSVHIPPKSKNPAIYETLIELLQAGHMLDATIKDDVKSYKIHLVVLTANSPKYRTHFMENETAAKEITIKGIQTDCLGYVLQFLYTGHLVITKETVADILEIALQLDLPFVKVEGERFLKCYDVTCALDFLPLAIDYDLEPVVAEIAKYLRRYSSLVLEQDSFVNLDADCLLSILEFGENYQNDELVMLQKVLQWFSHSLDVRKVFAETLMTTICWENIPIEKIDSIIDANPELFESEECQDALYDAFKYHALKAVEEGYEPKVADWKNAPFFEDLSKIPQYI